MIRVLDGDMRDVVPTLDRIDCVVTDPPYEIGMMNRSWDKTGVAFQPDTWWPVFTAMKPGAHLVAFGSTRTFHRLVCAIEDAGFEIRDTLCWITAAGFPKSHNISKAIDKAAGAERHREVDPKGGAPSAIYAQDTWTAANAGTRLSDKPITPEAAQWQGWGSALKPAMELICLARKPLEGTLAQNTLKHGVGGLHIDACRVETDESTRRSNTAEMGYHGGNLAASYRTGSEAGRWPSNVMHDGSDEVLAAFAAYGERPGATSNSSNGVGNVFRGGSARSQTPGRADTGSAARFFFSSKADKADRADSKHPTVKPLDLMVWLTKLVCPPGGTVLDPFAGSGTTAEACMRNGFDCILVEQNPEYCRDIRHRIRRWSGEDSPLFATAAD